MSRFRFELATTADDADLRQILADTPMPGRITVSFRREPSYFDAAQVDGRFRQVVAARDYEENRLVGFGSRSVSERYVNGRPETIGYLTSLRLLPAYRNRGLVARGYAFFRKLHADGRARLYLTTIAERNTLALALLTSGRAGLPTYHYAGRYHTLAFPVVRRRRAPRASGDADFRPATADDLPAVLRFLETVGPRRQFFPHYQAGDFFAHDGTMKDLRPTDMVLALRRGQLVGMLAGWDQHRFRQTVVHGYEWPLGWLRPFYNAWATGCGKPRLPGTGDSFRYLTAALPLVAEDDPRVFALLLEALQSEAGPWEYALLGLHETDPLLTVVKTYRATWYSTRLYLVCWEDGEGVRAALDGRPPYLELGTL
ncbi:MAG TPA: hypothetical protein VGZ26_12410 [Pirellulales bacterium]|nr:hypothetical protein [Pirellulales bacterium]